MDAEHKSMWHNIFIRTVSGIFATVIGTLLVVFLLKWLSVPAVAYAGYKRITRGN